jgi:putative ATPase
MSIGRTNPLYVLMPSRKDSPVDLFDRVKKASAPLEPEGRSASVGDTVGHRDVHVTVREAGSAPLSAPLADRMRPRTLDELAGHGARVGPTTPLGRAILADRCPSLILWGPPGCGKTSLARVIAAHSKARFEVVSAVLSGVAELRSAVARAEVERRAGRRTILFVDEIHRFHKGQQDALLPHVEAGTVTLLGATTENPSFALNSAVLSRAQVLRFDPLDEEALAALLRRALEDRERGLGAQGLACDPRALALIARWADGDARRALGLLETIAQELAARERATIEPADVEALAKDAALRYDRDGEEHYNLSSALIKSLRGSDPDAALYWAVRMIEAGEDPLFVLRRLLIFAAEDVGMADPRGVEVVAACDHAVQRVGMPEAMIPLAHAVTYLALAPKSKSAYRALRAAQAEVQRSGALPVPMHLRNAPTAMMKQMGYGAGYRDPHESDGGWVAEHYLPDALRGATYYRPTTQGVEAKAAESLARRRRARDERG